MEADTMKKPDIPKILWHHGTCDFCKRRLTLVCHFGYDTQPERDYRLCLTCLSEHIQTITFGWMRYKVDDNNRRLGEEQDK